MSGDLFEPLAVISKELSCKGTYYPKYPNLSLQGVDRERASFHNKGDDEDSRYGNLTLATALFLLGWRRRLSPNAAISNRNLAPTARV